MQLVLVVSVTESVSQRIPQILMITIQLQFLSSKFGLNSIFEFDPSIKALEFYLVIVSTFFLSFTNVIKPLNTRTYVKLFTDCSKSVAPLKQKVFLF